MLQANQLTCDKATVSTVLCDLIVDGQSGQKYCINQYGEYHELQSLMMFNDAKCTPTGAWFCPSTVCHVHRVS